MPVLTLLAESLARDGALVSTGVLLNLHLTSETLALGGALRGGGARVAFLHSGREEADRDVVAAAGAVGTVVDGDPWPLLGGEGRWLVVEGNGRILTALHDQSAPPAPGVAGVSIHTSSGARRLARLRDVLRVPVVAVCDDPLKRDMESPYGTGVSTAGALLRGLHRPVAGRRVAVVGFGSTGRGVARTLRALGARVRVADTDPEVRLRAIADGYDVATVADVSAWADVCVTTTGVPGVLDAGLLAGLRPGTVVATVGDEPREIDVTECERIGEEGLLSRWRAPGGAASFLLFGDGVQANHAGGNGNPPELMDVTFSLHAVALRWLARDSPAAGVHEVPGEARRLVAELVAERWR